MSEPTFTEEQARAISSRGEVIVSASAGSGKTFVMIERLVSLILSGADVRSTLCVTYTNKAAAQMRERLRTALLRKIGKSEGEERLRLKEQLARLPLADISTVHAFCSRLVRTYFYLADVSPAFRVISPDDAEGTLLSSRAMDEAFEQLYGEHDEAFGRLLAVYFRKKKDAELKKLVLKLYAKARLKADYRVLLEQTGSFEGFGGIVSYLAEEYGARARSIRACAEELAPFFSEHCPKALAICNELAAAAERISSGTLFERSAAAREPLSFTRSPTINAGTEEKLRSKLLLQRSLTGAMKKLYGELASFESEETERLRYENGQETARALSRLILRFDGIYDRLKREAGVLDYNDLEHCALRVLEDDGARAAVRGKYRYVFVDEYQDVNPAQERILSLLSGGEVFLVGDAKQAIYGFRGGRSEYFLKKTKEFATLPLSRNFRSAPAILEAVNRVFTRAMTQESCGADYLPMQGGERYGEHDGAVRFHLVAAEKERAPEGRGVYSVLTEPRPQRDAVAERIAELIEEEVGSEWFDVDKGLVKKVEYGDIAVLVRKNSGCAEAVVSCLSARDIPVTTTASVNLCDFWEARLILDWLSYLDNPEQDIPYAGALLSRLGGCSDAELAAIRLRFPSPYTFRAACREYAKKMRDGIGEKLVRFARLTERLRALMRVKTAAEMIGLLLAEGLEAEIAAKKDGSTRLMRVRRLTAEASGSVNDFLRRLKTLGFYVEYTESGGDRAVKVVTMHASKGLEYPVVILANLNTPFHGDREEVYFTEPFSFAPKCCDTERKLVYETVARRASELYSDAEEVKGELNLLYVAMTRAQYRLHLVFGFCEGVPSPRYASCFADFFDFADCARYFVADEAPLKEPLPRTAFAKQTDGELIARLKEAYRRPYPFQESTLLPVKSSATALMAKEEKEEARPAIGGHGGTVDEGLAYHAFLQHADFARSAAENLARLGEEGLLDEAALALLDPEKLERILALPSIASLKGKRLMREQTFLVSLPASEVMPGVSAADEIILQGAIDLLAADEDGYLILDYKYSSHDAARLRADYASQLRLYRKAVARAAGIDERTIRARIVNIMGLFEVEM